MSCTYKISTNEKKSIVEVETFTKTVGDQTYEVKIEQTWRWGWVIISDVEDTIDPENPDGLLVTDYSIDDQTFDDGCSLWFTYSDNVPDEEKELFESAWDDEGYCGIEDIGWSSWDTEIAFHGPLEVELLEQTDDEEEEEEQPKKKWPF